MTKLLRLVCKNGNIRYGIVMPDKRIMLVDDGSYFGDRLSTDNKDLIYKKSILKRDYISEITDEESLNKAKTFLKHYKDLEKLKTKMANLQKQIDAEKEMFSNTGKRITKEFKTAEQDKKIDEIMNTITGNENFSMSFTKHFDSNYVIAMIRKSNRPCFYRSGFAYRGASKHEITKEKAIEYIKTHGWLDVTATDDGIEINEFSENDMW